MSRQIKSEVGVSGNKRPSEMTTPHTSASHQGKNKLSNVPGADDGTKKKKGILVNVGGRVRTISETTLELLKFGTQLDISTHLMQKKLMEGFSSNQLDIAVAHARIERDKRDARKNGTANRKSSAELALEEAVQKYGDEVNAISDKRTISDILLQYSSPEKSRKISPPPTLSPPSLSPPLTPIKAANWSDTPLKQSSPIKDANLVTKKHSSSSIKKPLNSSGSSLLVTNQSSKIQLKPSRSHLITVPSKTTHNLRTSSSATSARGLLISRSTNRHATPSALQRPLVKQSQSHEPRNSNKQKTPTAEIKKSQPDNNTNKNLRKKRPSKLPPRIPSAKSSSATLSRGIGIPPQLNNTLTTSKKPSLASQVKELMDFTRRQETKPPIPPQSRSGPPSPHPENDNDTIPVARPRTAPSSSQKGPTKSQRNSADGRKPDPRDSLNKPTHTQRDKRSVGERGERANRFFHGGLISKGLRQARREIKYVPFDPEYRTITDPTYGRYRHFYMGMMDRIPPGFPVSLRNALFPLPPPPDAPSLRRYRNPLKIPLRKVGLERDDYITRPAPDTPFTFRPVPPSPNPWKNRPPIVPNSRSVSPPTHRASSSAKPPSGSSRNGGRADPNGNRFTPHDIKRTAGAADLVGQRENYWKLFPSTSSEQVGRVSPDAQEGEDFWEVQAKRRAERAKWAERIRQVVRVEREFVEAYKPYFREEDDEYREYDSNFEGGPRSILMKLLENRYGALDAIASSTEDEDQEERKRMSLKEPLYTPFLWEARLEPFKFVTDNDYHWSLQVSENGDAYSRRFVNWRESDLHDVYDMRCILEVFDLHEVVPYLKYNRTHDFRSTTMGTVEFLRGSVYIRGFDNILLTVVSDMAEGKGDKKRLGCHFGRNAKERASVRQWLTYAITNIRRKSRLGVNVWSEIECHLRTHNFFATSFYSVADVLMYISLYPFFKPLCREAREKYPFIADFIRTIQRDENVVRANKRLMIRNWEEIPTLNRPRH